MAWHWPDSAGKVTKRNKKNTANMGNKLSISSTIIPASSQVIINTIDSGATFMLNSRWLLLNVTEINQKKYFRFVIN